MHTLADQLKLKIQFAKHHIHNFTDAELRMKPGPNKWSKIEILGHLIDSARVNLARFNEVILTEEAVVMKPYPQDAYVRINAYQTSDCNHLVYLWQSLNDQMIHLWRNFPSEDPGFIIKGEAQSSVWWAEDYVNHFQHHLDQIFSEEKAQGHALSKYQVSLVDAERVFQSSPELDVIVAQFGDLEIEYYKPDKVDKQQAHDRDELYIVISGSGKYLREGKTYEFKPHDVLFAKAGERHRFESFSEDFATWVVFYGMRRF